jgi:hypothetical protein
MTREFVTYNQAVALRELGFDEECLSYYVKGGNEFKDWTLYRDGGTFFASDYPQYIGAPLYQQAFRWFREKHGLYTEIFVDDDRTFGFLISYFIDKDYYDERVDKPIQRKYSTHEEAESACLDKLIEIVKNK